MRCKKHLPDLSSTIGVCASCLRERLQPLVEAQAKAQAQAQSARYAVQDVDRHRNRKPEPNPNPHPPELNFPRSVSPYVTRRKSDWDRRRERLFYSTPQVGRAACDGGTASSKRRLGGRFWNLSNLFRARLNKTETSSRESCEEPSSSASPPSTTSWFSTIIHARRHNHGAVDRRRCRQPDRGISHAVTEHFTDDFDGRDRSASGYSSESSPRKQNQTASAATTAARKSRLGPAGKGLTSMAFCLSPMVRASPNQHLSHKGFSQELGVGGAQHISNAASFCASRSRKLADFGRVSHNR